VALLGNCLIEDPGMTLAQGTFRGRADMQCHALRGWAGKLR